MGYHDVFPHVGSNTQIQVQGKLIWPLVTGTFGGTDFIHSLLGEATDKISQVSLTDLHGAVTDASMADTDATFAKLKGLLKMFPSGQSDLDKIQSESAADKKQKMNFMASNGNSPVATAQEIAKKIYPVLQFRDNLMKKVAEALEKVNTKSCP